MLSFRVYTIVLLALCLCLAETSPAQPGSASGPEVSQSSSFLRVYFWERNVDEAFLDATEGTDAVKLEIWDGYLIDIDTPTDVVNKRSFFDHATPFPANDGRPVLFRLTAPELERPIMSYTAWNYTPEFTYQATGTEPVSELSEAPNPCPSTPAVVIHASNTIVDSLDAPALYASTFLRDTDLECAYSVRPLIGNELYPHEDFLVSYPNPQGVIFEIGPKPLRNSDLPHYFYFRSPFPQGPIEIDFDLPGYRSIPVTFFADPCDVIYSSLLTAPLSPDQNSPVDEFPGHNGPASAPFPFPPPETYIQKAREELVLGKSVVFGYLERALNPEWDLTFGATTPYMGGTKEFVEENVVYTIDAPKWVEPGEGVEITLIASGDLPDLKAMNATLVFDGVTSGTESLISIDVLPGDAFTSPTFASHQQLLLNGDLELRAYAFQGSAGVPPASSRESSPLIRSRIPTATSAGETPAIPLLRFNLTIPEDFPAGLRINVRLRTELDGDIALTSLADFSNRLFTAPGSPTGTYQPHAPTQTQIRISSGPATATGWIME